MNSIEISICPRFFRKLIRAKLIAILVSQDEKLDLSSKSFKCKNALMRDSWSTSSASCQFFTIRYARRRILLEWRLLSSTKATGSPDFAAEINTSSRTSFKVRLMSRSLADGLGGFITPSFAPTLERRATEDIDDL